MEIIRGKKTLVMDASALAERLRGYEHILMDIGTGDGRFVRHVAETWPGAFALGIDACRENLREASRKAPGNALYLIANACALPAELHGLATHVTINFPWGSLLDGLLAADQGLMSGLAAVARPGARLELRLNGGALSEAGWSLETGAARVRQVLLDTGFELERPVAMGAAELRRLPTTWAKRLAFGRDPRGMVLSGSWGEWGARRSTGRHSSASGWESEWLTGAAGLPHTDGNNFNAKVQTLARAKVQAKTRGRR